PGANVIDVVDRIKRQLPQLQAALPAAIDVAVLTDRTVTIRASVHDVQVELLLAVALVVTVIFVFLRKLRATIIPSVAVPLSLIAVLIPLLFMGDVVGRLFREFAVTLAVAILISAVVSLTLTPMMCARLLRPEREERESRFARAAGRAFDAVIVRYGRALDWVLDRQAATLLVWAAALLLTVLLYFIVPKGFFPVQDTGVILGITEAPQSISFPAMAERQRSLAHAILQDPAVASLSSFIGVDGTNVTLNSGRMLINLKPLSDRGIRATDVIRRLQQAAAQVAGITLYMQSVQDLTVEDRVSRTQYQYTLSAADGK